jgi:hypothetical protein
MPRVHHILDLVQMMHRIMNDAKGFVSDFEGGEGEEMQRERGVASGN